MNKVEFKLVSRHYDKSTLILKGSYFDTRVGSVCTLFTDGTFVTRKPLPQEESQVWDIHITSTEPVVDSNGNPTGHHRSFKTFSYVPKEQENEIIDPIDKELNIKYRNLHVALAYHGDVSVKNERGEEQNPNAIGDVQFQLINVTENVLVNNKKNQRRYEAGQKLQELFKQDDKKAFIDFCYAYSIPMVDKFDAETLYNLCSQKINDNPDWFFHIYDSKQRDILTLIQMGLTKDISNGLGAARTALTQNGESFYMDGNYLAGNREELEGILSVDVSRRRILETMVNFSITSAKAQLSEVKEVKIDAMPVQTKAELQDGEKARTRWLEGLKGQALGAQRFSAEKEHLRQERYKQIHEEYDTKLGAEVVQSVIEHFENKRLEKEATKAGRVPLATAMKD